MRKIKFRGTAVNTGELVYGDLTHDNGHIFVNDRRVFATSVAQFLGFDDNGDEIYEGDALRNSKTGEEFNAELAIICYSTGGASYFQYADEVEKINLVKSR